MKNVKNVSDVKPSFDSKFIPTNVVNSNGASTKVIRSVIKNVAVAVEKSPTGCSFVSLTGYTKTDGELQNAIINVGCDLQNAKAKDVVYLMKLDVSTLNSDFSNELLNEAKEALLNALIKPSKVRSQGQKNAYTSLGVGVKQHNTTKEVYIFGFSVSKKVLKASDEVKEDKRKLLTKAKDFLRKNMKSTKYCQFILGKCGSVKVNGKTFA